MILRGVAAQVAKSNWISSTLSVVKINGFVNDHLIRSGCAGLAGRSCGWLSTHSCTPLRDERTAQIVTTMNAVPFNQFSRFVCILSRRRGYLLISLKSAYWYSFFFNMAFMNHHTADTSVEKNLISRLPSQGRHSLPVGSRGVSTRRVCHCERSCGFGTSRRASQ